MKTYCFILTLFIFSKLSIAQDLKAKAMDELNKKEAFYGSLERQIWGYAEVGYQEIKSSALLQDQLKKEGFKIQSGVAEIPTAFTATFGEGKPIIAIFG